MTTKTTRTDLTVDDIEAGYANDAWLGFGYLGERQRAGSSPAGIAAADAYLLSIANAQGWTPDELFAWLNSKNGRHFGDDAFGGRGPAAGAYLVRRIA
jgi:hypothetical protein